MQKLDTTIPAFVDDDTLLAACLSLLSDFQDLETPVYEFIHITPAHGYPFLIREDDILVIELNSNARCELRVHIVDKNHFTLSCLSETFTPKSFRDMLLRLNLECHRYCDADARWHIRHYYLRRP